MEKNYGAFWRGASILILGASAQAAWAQPAREAGLNSDAEIIVTARRKDERLQDVPTSIRAVSAETLEKLNIRDFKDIQSIIPGLQLTNASNGYSTGATVRGIKFDVESGGTNPSVEFYLNDAPITSNILFGAMYDIGQVEVLRGPQGTLRGRASPSGSITVTTRKPNLQDVGGYVLGTVNNLSGFNVNGAVNVPVIKDVFALRIAGYTDHSELNRTNSISNPLNPSSRTDSYRISARVEPTDYLTVNASYQRIDRKLRSFDQVASYALFDPTKTGGRFIRPEDRLAITDGINMVSQKFDQFNWSADLRFAGQKLSYVGSHSLQHNRTISPQDAANVLTATTPRTLNDPAGAQAVCAYNTRLLGYQGIAGEPVQCLHSRSSQDSHELRLASEERVLGMFAYVVGGFVNHYNTPSDITRESALFLSPVAGGGFAGFSPTSIIRTARSTEKSLFGNVTAYLGEKTELSGGVRYINYRANDGLSISLVPKPNNSDRFNAVIYAASLKHNFSDDVMAYASVGSSWRPGIRAVGDFSANQSALEQSFLNLAPEKSTSYEVGVKTAFWDRRVHLNLSAFHQDFTNYAYRAPTPVAYIDYVDATTTRVSTFNFVAANPVKVDGVEVETSFDVSRGWNIGANFSYANGRIKNGRVPCTDLNGDGVPDANPGTIQVSQLPAGDHVAACNYSGSANSVPKWTATIQSEYSHALIGTVDGYVRGLLNIFPDYENDPSNPFDDVKAYTLFNLYAGLRSSDGGLEISFFAKNLFDTFRTLTVNNLQTQTAVQVLQPPTFRTAVGETRTSNYLGITTTAPREFGVSLRYAFGSR